MGYDDSVMIRIALTGGIASGKSTVARRLGKLGALVIDYDALSHTVVGRGSTGLHRVVDAFGSNALDDQGCLNRPWLAQHVFGTGAADGMRSRLESIIHPLVYEQALRIEQEHHASHAGSGDAADVVVHDVPLLVEVIRSIPFDFRHVLSVEAPVEVRIARMVNNRHMTRDQAIARIDSQSTQAERNKIADHVIDSTQPIEQMFDEVDRLYAQWRAEVAAIRHARHEG